MAGAVASRIPVTVLTGYLGAGKTTLLNHILSADRGRRYAVIVNEFGAVGIDNALIVGADEELFELSNGCICCTVRGDLIRTLHGLLSRRGDFEAIIVETTGLADPGPVAQTFFVDQFLQARTVLDSVTTVVDARHVRLRLADSREAREQIAFADQIVLNKTDLVSAQELHDVAAQVRALNRFAPIHRAQRSNVAVGALLGRGGFDLERIASLAPDEPDDHGHDAHCGHDHGHDHDHDGDIGSVSFVSPTPIDGAKAGRWLADLVSRQGRDILRAKGIIHVAGEDRRLVFQSVHMQLEGDFLGAWKAGEPRRSRLVFIGRNLNGEALRAGFEACAASPGQGGATLPVT